MPAARALSSPYGEAAAYNIVEREKILGRAELRNYVITDNVITDGQTDVEFEIVF